MKGHILFKRKKKHSKLDDAIDEVFSEMAGFSSDADEYDLMTAQLERLYAIKQQTRTRVDPNTWVIAGANIIGVLVIVGYERTHIVTSKALNAFITRVRV